LSDYFFLNEVVAITGDGVNDASVLSQADRAIAMELTGTNVEREASRLILNDDNFATIVTAVEMGRSIFDNMKAFIRYLISSNIGEVVAIFSTALLCIPETLSSVQLLWVNLVTDGMPATALGFNPPEKGNMLKPPRKPGEPLISGWTLVRYIIIGAYVGFATIAVFVYWYLYANTGDGHPLISWRKLSDWSECEEWPENVAKNLDYSYGANDFSGPKVCDYFKNGKTIAATMSLSVVVLIEMLNAFNAISENDSLLVNPPWKNKWLILAVLSSMAAHCIIMYVPTLYRIFNLVPLKYAEWRLVVLFSFPVLLIDEVLKFFSRRMLRKQKEQEVLNKKLL